MGESSSSRARSRLVVVRLGVPGVVHGVNVDTRHFNGNQPEAASIEGCFIDADVDVEALSPDYPNPSNGGVVWRELLPSSPLGPNCSNPYAVEDNSRVTHLRLHIYPDGGVARLRVYGGRVPIGRRWQAWRPPVTRSIWCRP